MYKNQVLEFPRLGYISFERGQGFVDGRNKVHSFSDPPLAGCHLRESSASSATPMLFGRNQSRAPTSGPR